MIKKYTAQDRQTVKQMMIEFYDSPAVLKKVPDSYFDTTLNLLENNSPFVSLYLFYCGDGEIAGYGLLSHSYSNEVGGLTVLLEEIYIRQAFRGQSLGSQFLDFVRDNYSNCRRLRLEVEPDNHRAINLYQRKGYKVLPYLQYVIDSE